MIWRITLSLITIQLFCAVFWNRICICSGLRPDTRASLVKLKYPDMISIPHLDDMVSITLWPLPGHPLRACVSRWYSARPLFPRFRLKSEHVRTRTISMTANSVDTSRRPRALTTADVWSLHQVQLAPPHQCLRQHNHPWVQGVRKSESVHGD
jgi:hypothetical protein